MGTPVELRLYPEAILTGTVVGPDGVPLPRISVVAERRYFDDTGHRWMMVGQNQTDSHGIFRIPVQAGDYQGCNAVYAARPYDRRSCFASDDYGDGSPGASEAFRVRSGEERHFELRPAVSPTHFVTIVWGSVGWGR